MFLDITDAPTKHKQHHAEHLASHQLSTGPKQGHTAADSTYVTLSVVHAVWRKARHERHLPLRQAALHRSLEQVERADLHRRNLS